MTDVEPASILIEIDGDNQYRVDNREIRPNALRAHLELLHSEHPAFSVIVLPARTSTAQALVTAIDTARAAGIYDVAVSEQNP